MYLQMAGLVFMPTGAIVYVINYADLDRQHLAQELDERYERFIHWGDVPDDFSYRAPYRHQFRDGVVTVMPSAASTATPAADMHEVMDGRFHWRRLRLMDHVYAGLRSQRAALVPGGLPLQDRLLDLALAECTAGREAPVGGATSRPLLRAMAEAWGTTLVGAAERVRIEHADRHHALVQSELHRLRACAQVRAARDNADLDVLFTRYGCHE